MKIIQSYNLYDKDKFISSRWDVEYIKKVFSLSFEKAKQLYGKVIFYGNKNAISFMKDDLWINYDKFIELEEVKSKYRARVKFEVYKQQKEEFIHIDNDVIMFKKYEFDEFLFQWIENIESWNWYNYKANGIIEKYVKLWTKAINVWVFWVKDLDFLRRYTDKVINIFDTVDCDDINNVTTTVEQMLLYNMIEEEHKSVRYILDEITDPDKQYPVISNVYIHLLWPNKKAYKDLISNLK